MYIWPKEIQQIIAEVLHAQNPITCLEKFKNYEPAKKITFLLFDGNQTTNFQYITHDYNLSKYRIVNLGNYANTAIITTSMLLDKNDLTAIKTAYSVNIDSNIVSMLPQLLKNKPITPDFLNFLVYIKKNNLDLNISPYLLEDSLNSSGMKNEARAYECLLSFFSFSDLSLQQLYSLPISPDVIAFNHADDAWSQMKYSRFYERNDEKRVHSIYCFLLKVYIIEFGSKKSSRKKLIELVDFINTNLGIYSESGLLLAYWYFNKSYNCVLDFFQKIQPGAKDKLKKVEGMAWDLFHLWDIPTEMAVQSHTYNAIILQAFATHDDALAQIAKLNPIVRIAFYQQEAQVKYKLSLSNFLHNDPIIDSIIDNQKQRECLCETVDLIELSTQLEHEFLNTIK